MVPHSPAAPAGRQSAGGSLCQRSPFRPNPSASPPSAGPHRVHGRLGPGAPCPWRRPGRRTPILDIKPYLPYGGLATREATAGLPASRRVPRWRWKSHPPCWTNCLRTGGGPAGCVGLGSPSPVSAGPGPGVRLPLRRAGGEIHRGWRPPAGRGHQMNARHPGYFPGRRLFRALSAWPASRRRSPPARRGCRPRRSRWQWPSPPARKPSWRGSRWYLPAGSSSETAHY